jgi:aryl-alcohol dehydrogenase-like predicted oxidoreductase
MEQRQFGRTGLVASALGMGCSRLGSFLTHGSSKDAVTTINLAVEHGISYFDTSDIYGQGDSERILGAALHGRRDKVMLATKAGRKFSTQARFAARVKAPIKLAMRLMPTLSGRIKQARSEQISLDFTPQYLTAALEQSLRRLRTDWVDVFMLHSPPAAVLEDGELFHRLSVLKQQGKVRCLGISVAEIAHASTAASLPGIQVIQLPIGRPHRATLESVLLELAGRGVAAVGREVLDGVDRPLDGTKLKYVLREALNLRGLAVVLLGMSSPEHLEANLSALT